MQDSKYSSNRIEEETSMDLHDYKVAVKHFRGLTDCCFSQAIACFL